MQVCPSSSASLSELSPLSFSPWVILLACRVIGCLLSRQWRPICPGFLHRKQSPSSKYLFFPSGLRHLRRPPHLVASSSLKRMFCCRLPFALVRFVFSTALFLCLSYVGAGLPTRLSYLGAGLPTWLFCSWLVTSKVALISASSSRYRHAPRLTRVSWPLSGLSCLICSCPHRRDVDLPHGSTSFMGYPSWFVACSVVIVVGRGDFSLICYRHPG